MSIEIRNQDCLEGMKDIKDGSVDLVVTSPPYNIDIDYDEYNDNKNVEDYLDWIEEVAKKVSDVLSEEGSFFLNLGDRPQDELRAFRIAQRVNKHFQLQNTIHWIKHIDVPQEEVNRGHYRPINSGKYLSNCHEYIFHFTKKDVEMKKKAIGVPYSDKRNIHRFGEIGDNRGRGNTWFIPYETTREEQPHPAFFPKLLPEMCIRVVGKENVDMVVDPFAGIGTTGLACRKTDSNFIGFEISEEYVKEAKSRFKQGVQLGLSDL